MGTYIINDPVHGPMGFTKEEHSWIKPLIDHELFQRLRDIKQNGLAHLVFPGAVHTRFNHCIGACWVAKRMMDSLENNLQEYVSGKEENGDLYSEEFKKILDNYKYYKRLVMQAALLHDITHGPMSHAFDKLFEGSDIEIVHEDWTESFVEEILGAVDYEDKVDNDVINITNLITGNRDQNNLKEKLPLFLFDIISSQLDADRLDYLLRDSHFCGVAYGKYRIDWIIQCLTLSCKDKDFKKWRLGILPKAIGDIEHYLMARRLMSLHVYSHKKVSAAQHLFGEFLRLLLHNPDKVENKNLKLFMKEIKELLKKLDKKLSGQCIEELEKWFIQGDKKANLLQVIKSLFCKNPPSAYECYKNLRDSILWDEVTYQAKSGSGSTLKLSNRLLKRELPLVMIIEDQNFYSLKKNSEIFIKEASIESWKLKCERPISDFYTYKNEKEIFIVDTYTNMNKNKKWNKGKKINTSTNIKHLSRIAKEFLERPDKPSYLYIDRETLESSEGEKIVEFIFKQMDIGLIASYNKAVLWKLKAAKINKYKE